MNMVGGGAATSARHVEQAFVCEFEESIGRILGLFIVSSRGKGIGQACIRVTMDETVGVFGQGLQVGSHCIGPKCTI